MAMDSWPAAGDISGFLADAGLEGFPTDDLENLVGRAVDELHSATGIQPFMAGSQATLTEVSVDGTVVLSRPFAAVASVSADGAAIPFSHCPQAVVPIRRLVLEGGFSGEVEVVGKPGFGVTVPIDIWYAVRDLAASYAAESAASAASPAVESVKQDTVTVKYATGFRPERFAEILAERAHLVFARYRLAGMGA